MISNIGPAIFSVVALVYFLVIIGSITLAIWGFITLLRIQTNTKETSAKLDRVIELLELQKKQSTKG